MKPAGRALLKKDHQQGRDAQVTGQVPDSRLEVTVEANVLNACRALTCGLPCTCLLSCKIVTGHAFLKRCCLDTCMERACSEHFLLRVSTTFINMSLIPTADFLCCALWGVTWVVHNLHPSMCTTCLQLRAPQVCSASWRSRPQCSHWPPRRHLFYDIPDNSHSLPRVTAQEEKPLSPLPPSWIRPLQCSCP